MLFPYFLSRFNVKDYDYVISSSDNRMPFRLEITFNYASSV